MSEEAKDSKSKEKEEVAEENLAVNNVASPKKGKMIIIIAAAILLLSVIGGVVYFSLFHNKVPAPAPVTTPSAGEAASPAPEGGEHAESAEKPNNEQKSNGKNNNTGLYKNLDDFLVDLKASGTTSFIKIDITLKVDNQDTLKIIDDKLPVIRDSFITYLRELKTDDLYGSSGLFVLKQELLMRVNKIVSPGAVEEIYIQNILTR